MKKIVMLLVVAVLLSAVPVFAQGPFTDVPTDHWAYDAVNTLQKDGILIGYPDGTFGGKRTLTRYEFATAVARLAQYIEGIETPVAGKAGVTEAELQQALQGYAKTSELPQNFATKADVEAISKLVNEFRDELAALGVDVDALKRDVAALNARVCALEAMVKRVQIYGDATVFAIAGSSTEGQAFDLDNRALNSLRDITTVRDIDLKVVGRVSDSTTFNTTINYGNYLNYLGAVDDYVSGFRPVNKTDLSGNDAGFDGGASAAFAKDFTDTFFPYYGYIDSGLGKGSLTVGRFPLQFTPYTLKMIDVDSYTNIMKTSDGNYPVDGAKLAYNFGGVDLTLFAVKNDSNDYLANGLTAIPNAGLYQLLGIDNHAVGGLAEVTQTAGARVVVGTPFNGVLGGTFYQAWDRNAYYNGEDYDQARVFGADLAIPVPFLFNSNLTASWTQSDTLAASGAIVGDITDNNAAWDAKLNFGFGKLGFGAGYKSIDGGFAAAGAWDKIGQWTNPVNIKGPYADIVYPFGEKIKFMANGEFLTLKDAASPADAALLGGFGTSNDDEIIKAEAGLKWGFSCKNALDVSYQWVKFSPDSALDSGTEQYLTVGWSYQVNPNAALRLGYQWINWNGGDDSIVYGSDYKGQLGVASFGVSF